MTVFGISVVPTDPELPGRPFSHPGSVLPSPRCLHPPCAMVLLQHQSQRLLLELSGPPDSKGSQILFSGSKESSPAVLLAAHRGTLRILGVHRVHLLVLQAGALFCRTNSSSLPGSWLCRGPVLSHFLVQSSGNGGLALTNRARQAGGLSLVPLSAQRLLSWEVCP